MSGGDAQPSAPAKERANLAANRRRPPVEHQFKKGVSGNPKGRPPKPKAPTGMALLDRFLLEEAHRTVRVNEGGAAIEMSALQAMVRSLVVRGLKGDHRSQVAYLRLYDGAEARRLGEGQTRGREETSDLEDILALIAAKGRPAPHE